SRDGRDRPEGGAGASPGADAPRPRPIAPGGAFRMDYQELGTRTAAPGADGRSGAGWWLTIARRDSSSERTDPMSDRVETLFHQASDLPPDRRRALLDAACRDDPGLRAKERIARVAPAQDALHAARERNPDWPVHSIGVTA